MAVAVDYAMMTDIEPCVVHCRVVSGRHGDVVTVQRPRCISDVVTHRQPSSDDDTLHTDNDLTLTDTCAQVAAQFFTYISRVLLSGQKGVLIASELAACAWLKLIIKFLLSPVMSGRVHTYSNASLW